MHRATARIFGVLFILSFLSYGIGRGMMDIVTSSNLYPGEIWDHKYQL